MVRRPRLHRALPSRLHAILPDRHQTAWPPTPALIAYFGGDWLAFLEYLGEVVHPGEQIITALPESKVIVAGASMAAAAAAVLGIPAEEAAKIATTYWGGDTSSSPVEARVAALSRYWAALDEVHARQTPGMPSLWGLIAESDSPVEYTALDDGRFTPYAFLDTLPPDLLAEIDRLWGRVITPAKPDVMVTASSPHYLIAQGLGPALEFWHGIALTAWFLCEGPYSRTDLEHAETYYGKRLEELEALDTPIDRSLFADLLAAKRRLKVRRPAATSGESFEVVPGIQVSLSFSIGPDRYDGFEHLRDVITRHRRAWAAEHLEAYLRRRWDRAIRDASTTYQRLLSESGKPPTLKVYARKVVPVVNEWFGGDVSLLYAAIGEKCPATTTAAARVMPADPRGYWLAFVAALPEFPTGESGEEASRWQRAATAGDLGRFAFRWIQAWELLGREPSLDEAGRGPFMAAQTIRLRGDNFRECRIFGPDPGEAYDRFVAIAKAALTAPPPDPLAAPSRQSGNVRGSTVVLRTPVPEEPESSNKGVRGLLGKLLGGR